MMLTRRALARGLVGALGLATLARHAVTRPASAGGRGVDLAPLQRAFAPPAKAPDLLLSFARWLQTAAAAGLPLAEGLGGDRGSWTDRFDEHWIEEGADLSERFAPIIPLGDGSQIALWNRADGNSDWPVVLIGGEGEAAVLADTLAGFLARLALAKFDEPADVDVGQDGYSWLEFRATIEDEDAATAAAATAEERADLAAARIARKALGDWLRTQVGQDDLASLARRRTPYGALREFFDAHVQSVHARQQGSAHWRALRELMDRHAPVGRLAIARDVQILCAADHFAMGGISRRVFTPFEDRAKAEPIVRALREERVMRLPAHGLWFSATLRVYPRGTDGPIDLVTKYLNPLDEYPGMPTLPADAIRADFKRYPRTPWWTPDWLQAICRA